MTGNVCSHCSVGCAVSQKQKDEIEFVYDGGHLDRTITESQGLRQVKPVRYRQHQCGEADPGPKNKHLTATG